MQTCRRKEKDEHVELLNMPRTISFIKKHKKKKKLNLKYFARIVELQKCRNWEKDLVEMMKIMLGITQIDIFIRWWNYYFLWELNSWNVSSVNASYAAFHSKITFMGQT